VFQLEHRHAREAQHEADAGLVQLLHPGHLVHRVFGSGAERLDHVEPGAFGSAARRGRTFQFPTDVVDRMPGVVAVDDPAAVLDRAAQMREPVQEHGRCHPGQRAVVDGDAATAPRPLAELHRRGVDRSQGIQDGKSHVDLQDTVEFLIYRQ